MPKCDRCKKNVSSSELAPMPCAINVLACSKCRAMAPHVKGAKKQCNRRRPEKEDRMADKQIFSFNVFQEERGEEKDYRFELNVLYSGLNIKLSKSMDEVRDFFTRQRMKRAKKHEESVAQG